MPKAAPAAAPAYDADTAYQVQLTRPVPIPGGFLNPMHRHRIKGAILSTFEADAIAEAVPATSPVDLG